MATIGNLEIIVSAETTTFDTKVDHVKRKVSTLGTVVNESSKGLRMMGKAFLVAEAGASALRVGLAYLSDDYEKIKQAWSDIPVIGQYFQAAFGALEEYSGLNAAKKYSADMDQQIEFTKRLEKKTNQLNELISGVNTARSDIGLTEEGRKIAAIYRLAEEKKKAFQAIIDSMREAGELKIDVGSYSKNLDAALDSYVNDALSQLKLTELENRRKKITDFARNIQLDIDTMNMSPVQSEMYRLQKEGLKNEFGPEFKNLERLTKQYEKMTAAQEEAERIQQEVQQLYSSTRTPMEQYESAIGRLNQLLQSGAIDWDLYSRAVRKAKNELEGIGALGKLGMSVSGSGGLLGRSFAQMYDTPAMKAIATNTGKAAKNTAPAPVGSVVN